MSASLIGRLGSSTFRPSTTTALMSLTGSCFSSESAPIGCVSFGAGVSPLPARSRAPTADGARCGRLVRHPAARNLFKEDRRTIRADRDHALRFFLGLRCGLTLQFRLRLKNPSANIESISSFRASSIRGILRASIHAHNWPGSITIHTTCELYEGLTTAVHGFELLHERERLRKHIPPRSFIAMPRPEPSCSR